MAISYGSKTVRGLQAEVVAWHRGKYPKAYSADVAVKLGEEVGEVFKAINRIAFVNRGADPVEIDAMYANLREEIGDVTIVLMVLAERYGLDFAFLLADRIETVLER